MERLHFEKGKAAFTLKDRLQRHRVSHPDNSMPNMVANAESDNELDDLEENIQWFEAAHGNTIQIFGAKNPGSVGVSDSNVENDDCEAKKSDTGNRKFKAQFGRRRTHNEQTLVRPCGVIFARATFFGAEAVSNVLVSLHFIIVYYFHVSVIHLGLCEMCLLSSRSKQT